ncbi:MAG: DsbA family protein [Deltaproteobacteria bacterium]|nr:DsbA family protein [Deltaproteobacteria bacterium]
MSVASRTRGALVHTYLRMGTRQQVWHKLRRSVWKGTPKVTFWHQVDDPWSDLLAQALPRFLEAFPQVQLEVEIVPPPAADADPEPQLRMTHAMRDARDLALLHRGIRFPEHPAERPADRVRRANAALLGIDDGREALEAAVRIGRALWNDDAAALRAEVDAIGAVPGHQIDPMLEDAYARLRKAGHYQGAMLHYGGEWFWGVDRLPHLGRRLESELGLEGELRDFLPEPEPLAAGLPHGRLEVFFSFRSPYSYLALDRLHAEYGETPSVELVLRPVLPMVTRGLQVPDIKKLYIARDAHREAKALGVPFGRIYDPLGEGVERCLRLFHVTPVRDQLRMALAAYRLIWAEAEDLTTDAGLAKLLDRAGLGPELAVQAMATEGWRDRVEANRASLNELGLWGVPCFRMGDEVAWGQDRLDRVHRWLRTGRTTGEHAVLPDEDVSNS